jgi:hypothetical protein
MRLLVSAGLFLHGVSALAPRNQNPAPTNSTAIEMIVAGGRTFTVPAGYTPTPAVPLPAYMVDNQHNYFRAAPDRYNASDLVVDDVNVKPPPAPRLPLPERRSSSSGLGERQSSSGSSSYWLANMGHGSVRRD